MTSETLNTQATLGVAAPPVAGGLLDKVLATEGHWAGLVLRGTLGIVMFPHAAQKAFGWFGGFGFDGTVGFFESIGLAAPVGALLIMTELVASLALLLGLGGRVAALAVAGIMVGAVLKVHAANGFFMNWFGTQAGEGFEFHLLAIAMAVALVLMGSGALSLDRVLAPADDGS